MSDQILLFNIDSILNNIAIKLFENDNLMKLLKFDTTDALSQSILEEQKYELINQEGDITNTRIFFQPFNNKVITEKRSELRIYYGSFKPDNMFLTRMYVGFDIVVNNNIWRLDGGIQRPIKIIQYIMESLNNQVIGSIGELTFNPDSSVVLRFFNDSFTGYSFNLRSRLT